MAISKRTTSTGKTKWVARYRDHTGKEHAKTFPTQKQAKAHLQEQQRALRRGEWIDEKAAPTLNQLWPTWEATATTPGTLTARQQVGRNLGDLAPLQITQITPALLRAWVAHPRTPTGLGSSPPHRTPLDHRGHRTSRQHRTQLLDATMRMPTHGRRRRTTRRSPHR